ncbi:hypothetical protein PHYBLDRAFT_69877 [Phycomyces blakesleeanus NRRL 1555(-)]|uniref:Uncharacterized protein n=1 Tax=Phycomyces blakesleeanus (strain ATCC 8743b / DSM 1359 / FGSC 10004 / NBRC 33097 / NRRL 1555) TaxID=763407 RepID=A0A162N5M3_PHYB8|nr:hypothetical protein PHYBLDRAFT_69877 [Phycomyces blakesleeanus NRRL 1555(-)]OAD66034.1 hypothetical protein PHYBLDRAFT_69877 [Phycomyces blakesleeanus NRRL 1555(-)]|eukprot:XP_018284074.1 hypothetical protein PHYBLDRAFT_69877 [Phycomyces blakesleeanus NRRL 1555(-)]
MTRLFAVIACLSDVRCSNSLLSLVWHNLIVGEMNVVETKSIKGMPGLVNDANDKSIRVVVWPITKDMMSIGMTMTVIIVITSIGVPKYRHTFNAVWNRDIIAAKKKGILDILLFYARTNNKRRHRS